MAARTEYPKVCHDISAQLISGLEVRSLQGRERAPSQELSQDVQSLPLIVRESQWVKFADRHFHLRQEGLYRFWDWGKVSKPNAMDMPTVLDGAREYSCVILYRKDVLTLLHSLAAVHVHGYVHGAASFEDKLKAAKRGSVSMICGETALFLCKLLPELGIQTRFLVGMRLEGPYNTYDNGHSVVEMFWPEFKKWVAVDVDLHCLFVKGRRYLSALELNQAIRRGGDFKLLRLAPGCIGGVDTTPNVAGEYSCQLYLEPVFHDSKLLKEWVCRSFAAPGIGEGGFYWLFGRTPAERKRLAEYSATYRVIDEAEWIRRFYGGK